MKNKFLCVLALSAGLFGLVSCGSQGAVGPVGPTGATGQNGKDGADGKDGKDGIDGVDGKDGETPYIGENGNWWIGDKDTGVKAQGDKGDKGNTGATGATGATGDKGEDGDQGDDGDIAYSCTILPYGVRDVTLNGTSTKDTGARGYTTVNKGSAIEGEEITFKIYPFAGSNLYTFSLNGKFVSPELVDDDGKGFTSGTDYYEYTTTMVEGGFVVESTFQLDGDSVYVCSVTNSNGDTSTKFKSLAEATYYAESGSTIEVNSTGNVDQNNNINIFNKSLTINLNSNYSIGALNIVDSYASSFGNYTEEEYLALLKEDVTKEQIYKTFGSNVHNITINGNNNTLTLKADQDITVEGITSDLFSDKSEDEIKDLVAEYIVSAIILQDKLDRDEINGEDLTKSEHFDKVNEICEEYFKVTYEEKANATDPLDNVESYSYEFTDKGEKLLNAFKGYVELVNNDCTDLTIENTKIAADDFYSINADLTLSGVTYESNNTTGGVFQATGGSLTTKKYGNNKNTVLDDFDKIDLYADCKVTTSDTSLNNTTIKVPAKDLKYSNHDFDAASDGKDLAFGSGTTFVNGLVVETIDSSEYTTKKVVDVEANVENNTEEVSHQSLGKIDLKGCNFLLDENNKEKEYLKVELPFDVNVDGCTFGQATSITAGSTYANATHYAISLSAGNTTISGNTTINYAGDYKDTNNLYKNACIYVDNNASSDSTGLDTVLNLKDSISFNTPDNMNLTKNKMLAINNKNVIVNLSSKVLTKLKASDKGVVIIKANDTDELKAKLMVTETVEDEEKTTDKASSYFEAWTGEADD